MGRICIESFLGIMARSATVKGRQGKCIVASGMQNGKLVGSEPFVITLWKFQYVAYSDGEYCCNRQSMSVE